MYPSLADAIANAGDGATISLTGDVVGDGVRVETGSNFTLDLNGNTLYPEGQLAGSSGTTTNGLQLLKDSNIIIKNGTIQSEDAKILIQNYSNLTLDNVKLIGSPNNGYVLSNNFGTVVLKNGTEIIASDGKVAFDLYYGMNKNGEYDDGVTVTIADSSVKIVGPIEYGKADRADAAKFVENTHLYIPAGYALEAPAGYAWVETQEGTQTLEAISE